MAFETWARAPERYARAHERMGGLLIAGTPDDWLHLRIIDEETDKQVEGVVEVNCDAGWVRCLVRLESNDGYEMEGVNGDRVLKTERLEGKFRIERETK